MFYDELVRLDDLRQFRARRTTSRLTTDVAENTWTPQELVDYGAGVDSYGNVHIASTLDPARLWRHLE